MLGLPPLLAFLHRETWIVRVYCSASSTLLDLVRFPLALFHGVLSPQSWKSTGMQVVVWGGRGTIAVGLLYIIKVSPRPNKLGFKTAFLSRTILSPEMDCHSSLLSLRGRGTSPGNFYVPKGKIIIPGHKWLAYLCASSRLRNQFLYQ